MTGNDGTLAKGFIVFILLLFLGFAVTLYVKQPTTQSAKAVVVIPTPTTVQDAHSSKADRKLVLRTTGNTYNFFIMDLSGGNERLLFSKRLGFGSTMSIPFNAWDPTDTYIFVEEQDAGTPHYFVMKSTGGPVIDVDAVWKEKQIPYTIREATGWASGTLLIIYTSKDDGSKGPAFWFEIPSTAIIQLAR